MVIDILTLSLIIGIIHLMEVVVFFYLYKANRNIMGLAWWLMFSVAEVFGFLLIVLRKYPLFTPYSIIFGNLIIIAGTIFIYIGILRFFERKVNLKLIISFFLSFLILHLFFYFIMDDINLRGLLFSIYVAVITFATAITLNKFK